jgi:hypothetical protein
MVIERTPAAEIGARDYDPETRRFEHLDCGLRRAGQEIVIEGVRPEEDRRGILRG